MYKRRLNAFIPPIPKKLTESSNLALNLNSNSQNNSFLSQKSAKLLQDTHQNHLKIVAELAFGTSAAISQAERDLFRIIEAAERDESRMRNPRLLHHASQAWNLEFFIRGLVHNSL